MKQNLIILTTLFLLIFLFSNCSKEDGFLPIDKRKTIDYIDDDWSPDGNVDPIYSLGTFDYMDSQIHDWAIEPVRHVHNQEARYNYSSILNRDELHKGYQYFMFVYNYDNIHTSFNITETVDGRSKVVATETISGGTSKYIPVYTQFPDHSNSRKYYISSNSKRMSVTVLSTPYTDFAYFSNYPYSTINCSLGYYSFEIQYFKLYEWSYVNGQKVIGNLKHSYYGVPSVGFEYYNTKFAIVHEAHIPGGSGTSGLIFPLSYTIVYFDNKVAVGREHKVGTDVNS